MMSLDDFVEESVTEICSLTFERNLVNDLIIHYGEDITLKELYEKIIANKKKCYNRLKKSVKLK